MAFARVRCQAKAPLSVAEVLPLPPRGPTRVVAAGLKGDLDAAVSLAAQVDQACQAVGFKLERRRFNPHITIGRMRGGRLDLPQGGGKSPVSATFRVEEIVLMSSELRSAGSMYAPVARFALD